MSASASQLPPLFLAALLLPCALPAAQSGPPPPGSPPANETTEVTFRAETNLALVRFQAIGKKNDFVADLRADEIELREDGVPQKSRSSREENSTLGRRISISTCYSTVAEVFSRPGY